MDLLGDLWTPLVLREAFYGIRRFDEFQESLGIARNTLTDRLRRLVEEGLMDKQAYQNVPVRHDYALTEKGRDFYGVLAVMNRWGDRWLAGEKGVPVVLHHDRCGHDTYPEVVCAVCKEPVSSQEISSKMGPGYPPRLAERPDVQQRFSG